MNTEFSKGELKVAPSATLDHASIHAWSSNETQTISLEWERVVRQYNKQGFQLGHLFDNYEVTLTLAQAREAVEALTEALAQVERLANGEADENATYYSVDEDTRQGSWL